jgi:hypothetical protein
MILQGHASSVRGGNEGMTASSLKDKHVETVRRSGIMNPDAEELEGDGLIDAACDALFNEAPVVEEYAAIGAYPEEFAIHIRGVPGAYFLSALEFDDEGPFEVLDEARREAISHYGEFENFRRVDAAR